MNSKMNGIRINGKTNLPVACIFGSLKMPLLKNTGLAFNASYLAALSFGLLLCCSLSHAADSLTAPERLTAATPATPAPLQEHSSVQPGLPPFTPDQSEPVPTAVPEETDSADNAILEQDNKIVIVSRPQVTGLWAMTIPGAQCTEYYNFMEKGDVVVKSGAEWTYGKYIYQVPPVAEPGFPVLAMRIQYDNLQTDCSGNAIDQRGEDQQQYVKWTGPASMAFCTTPDGAQCFASLNRVLP